MSIVLFLACALLPGGGAEEGGAAPRASDSEPNDDMNSAVELADGEVVQGTLLVSSGGDWTDYYKITVPYGKMVNASMYMVDYSDADTGRYNFHISLYGPSTGWWASSIDSSTTQNRWESVQAIQYWDPAGPRTAYIRIRVNNTGGGNPQLRTQPGRYTVSASVSDIQVFNGGQMTDYLDGPLGPKGGIFYRLGKFPGENEKMRLGVQSPVTGKFSIRVYQVWALDHEWYLLNASWRDAINVYQEVYISGTGADTYYVKIDSFYGSGCFTFSAMIVGGSYDNDNVAPNAQLIRDLSPHADFVDQGVDWLDWYKVPVKAGKIISEVYIIFVSNNYADGSTFNISAYDQDLKYIVGTAIPYQIGWNQWVDYAYLVNLTTTYDGYLYFCVRALTYSGNTQANFVGANGWYKVTFTLPNDPPRLNGTVPPVYIDEDGTDSSLVLSNYFLDPDGDNLEYSLLGSAFKCKPSIDKVTGRVTFRPEANWSGTEKIRFQIKDDGPGNKAIEANTTVVVSPVNDQPYLAVPMYDDQMPEDKTWQTPDVATLFRDIDDSSANLTYSLRVIGSETHPPSAELPIKYDQNARVYTLGPVHRAFGNYTLAINCTDGKPNTLPPVTVFNLTVSHVNHEPVRAEGVPALLEMTVAEGGKNESLTIPPLFTDPDLQADYASDALNFTTTSGTRLEVSIGPNGRFMVDAGTEEYIPGVPYSETFKITARDRAGKTAVLNITVHVMAENDPPEIPTYQPVDDDFPINEGQRKSFTITATDVDTDTADLTYTWYLNDRKETAFKGPSYSIDTDYTMGGSLLVVRVEVSDGTTTLALRWNVTVVDVNRVPEGTIKSPANMTKYKKGIAITFQAEGSDLDGDNLTFIWRDQNGVELGRGTVMTTNTLGKGTQVVRLEITDDKASIFLDVTVLISTPSPPAAKGAPGFEAAALVLAGAAALLLLWRRR